MSNIRHLSIEEEMSCIKLYVLFQLEMSKTKHLNRSYKIIIIERYVFLKRVPQRSRHIRSLFNMQKDLSDWIDISKSFDQK